MLHSQFQGGKVGYLDKKNGQKKVWEFENHIEILGLCLLTPLHSWPAATGDSIQFIRL